jgi:hypothetical protein
MGKISPHEPRAELLSPEDVDKDVASLSEALMEKRAEQIARNVLRVLIPAKYSMNWWKWASVRTKRKPLPEHLGLSSWPYRRRLSPPKSGVDFTSW